MGQWKSIVHDWMSHEPGKHSFTFSQLEIRLLLLYIVLGQSDFYHFSSTAVVGHYVWLLYIFLVSQITPTCQAQM